VTDRTEILRTFLQAGPSEVKWAATSAAVVLGAIWKAFTSVLFILLLVLFFADVGLGVLKAVNVGGLKGFDRDRFGRAFLKLVAAAFGILLAASVDILLRHQGMVETATPVTTSVLAYMGWGFGWSAAANLAHFFPGIDGVIRGALAKLRDPDEPQPKRRKSDSVERGAL